jgi:hypothetical protein
VAGGRVVTKRKANPKRGGRPPIPIDEEQVKRLAMINCSLDEMASVLGCEKTTLRRRFATVIKRGREQGTMSLKRAQYTLAMKGNCTMQIWLGKQMLGQRDDKAPVIGDPQSIARQIREIAGALFQVAQ